MTTLPPEVDGATVTLRWRGAHLAQPYPGTLQPVLDASTCDAARREIQSWPGYAPTPLRNLAGLARALGVATVWLKDESGRFGLGSFKALGGAYAVAQLLAQADRRGSAPVFAAATDGNHGRAVSWAARQHGCRCVIYLHAGVSPGRERALADLGAEIVRVAGNYDDSFERAADDARRNDWLLVPDSSEGGHDAVARQIMAGYCVIGDEIAEIQGPPPTHLFVQAGVGAMAAALAADSWMRWGVDRPRVIVVEPERADCISRSLIADALVAVDGDLETVMAGLSCGRVSPLAWPILRAATAAAVTLSDTAVAPTMRFLRDAEGLTIGETGVAGVAAAIAAVRDPGLRAALGLDGGSRVLCIGTEGATDPDIFQTLISA
jgi:diaminopropionate ammonia-lyase